MSLKQTRQRAADLVRDMKAIQAELGGAGLNDEQRTALRAKFTALEVEADANAEDLARAERLADRERSLVPIVDEDHQAQQNAVAPIAVRERSEDMPKALAFGHFLQHVREAAVPGSAVSPELKKMAAASGLNETVPSEGGFLVGQEQSGTIRERMYETGVLLNRVNRQPIGPGKNGIKLLMIDETSRANGSRFGGIQSYWTAEAGEKLASKPKFRVAELDLKKVAALVYATDELLQDAVALESWIMRHLPDELTFKVEDSILSGTGAGQPLGILNSGAAISVTRTTAGQIQYTDVLNMWSRMYAPSRRTAIWLIDQGAEAQLFSMSLAIGTGGVPVFMPANGIAGQPFPTLFGRPIVTSEYGAALGTVGDFMFIDPSQYTLIDKGGVESAVSIHVRFIYDESVFRFVYRVDGQPDWNAALTPKSGGNTTSPFVLLAT